jgi:hypothetical protein
MWNRERGREGKRVYPSPQATLLKPLPLFLSSGHSLSLGLSHCSALSLGHSYCPALSLGHCSALSLGHSHCSDPSHCSALSLGHSHLPHTFHKPLLLLSSSQIPLLTQAPLTVNYPSPSLGPPLPQRCGVTVRLQLPPSAQPVFLSSEDSPG